MVDLHGQQLLARWGTGGQKPGSCDQDKGPSPEGVVWRSPDLLRRVHGEDEVRAIGFSPAGSLFYPSAVASSFDG